MQPRKLGMAEIAEAFGLTAHDNAFVSEPSTGLRRILDLAMAAARSGCSLVIVERDPGQALAIARAAVAATLRKAGAPRACGG